MEIITLDSLTKREIQRIKEFVDSRNLYKKYTLEELQNWLKVDLYEALDLDYYRGKAIPVEMIEYSARRKSVMYHPTNNKGLQQGFLIIKKAEKILSNSKFRKVYDSCYLDETIPDDMDYEPQEFFRVFSDCFDRNSIFTDATPVPKLRDDLESFYRFWQSFVSNRVFDSPEDVFDVSGSSRRYAAEKNKKIMEEKRVKEFQRIQELVRRAKKNDPRIPKVNNETSPWNEAQLKSLSRFNVLFGKGTNKYEAISKKLNELFLTKRTSSEIKTKLENCKK